MPESKPSETRAAVHVQISGRVQGVGFRYFVEEKASALGLSGWVCNRPDGQVEAEAEGPREALERWLQFLKTGNSLSRVENLNVQWMPHDRRYETFEIRS